MKELRLFPGYSITKDGKVFSHWRRKGRGLGVGMIRVLDYSYSKEIAMNKSKKDGYWYVTLFREGKLYRRLIHGLILDTYVGPLPEGQESRHLDGNKDHNNLGNLCYGSSQENSDDMKRHGRALVGSRNPQSKLTADEVAGIRVLAARGIFHHDIAKEYRCSRANVSLIVENKIWTEPC